MNKRILSFIMMITVLIACGSAPSFAKDVSAEPPKNKAGAALLMDVTTGEILYEKNATKEMYPASLTKMMTAIIVLEKLDLSKEVTVSEYAEFPVGNNINLKAGEKLTVEQLLNAMLIYSANDAALALAIEASGSVEAFCAEMNKKAKEIGCKHTNYINPNGFTNDAIHHTTAKDLATIAAYGLKNKTFREIVRKSTYTVPKDNKNKVREVETTNLLLRRGKHHYDGCIGVKTGFMALSGYCFVGAAERDGMQLIGVSLDSGDEGRFDEVADLFDYGFDNFKTVNLMEKGEKTGKIKVKYGHNTKAMTMSADSIDLTMPKTGDEALTETKVKLKDHVEAPIKKGTKVGTVTVYEDGEKRQMHDIVIAKTVEKGGPWTAIYISDIAFYMICSVLALILIVFVIIRIIIARERKRIAEKRRREREERARQIAAERKDKEMRGWPF